MWEVAEINQIWDPTGYRVVGFVDNNNQQAIYKVTTNHNLTREYHGVDFSVEARPSEHWDLYAAYTLSWLFGNSGAAALDQSIGAGPLTNLRQLNLGDGFLTDDTRHALKLRAAYNTHGFNVGANFQYVTGGPLSKGYFNFFSAGYGNLRSPQGTDPYSQNNPRGFSEFRLPDIMELDVRVSYDMHALVKQHIVLMADLFNLFDLRTPTSLTTEDTATPAFGSVGGRQGAFKFQLGARYVY
jgi:hypothetical protein